MIILHAGFSDNELLVWGETPRTNRRKPSRVSPYDAGAKALAAAIHHEGATRTIIAELPTAGGEPVPSSALIAPDGKTAAGCTVQPWEVTAVALRPLDCRDLLARCAEKDLAGEKVLEPGVVIADDLFYWAAAMRFAASLVARQQFLPDLVSTRDGFRARWNPVILDEDTVRLNQLSEAMPAAARALRTQPDGLPPIAPRALLSAFLTASVDAMVRPASAPRRSGFDSVHDQWLYALRARDGAMTGDPAQLRALADHVREWRRPIQVSAAAPYRLCFRIEEPEGERDDWRVHYLLQNRKDPSLLVPAEQAWHSNGKGPLGKQGAIVREHLLVSLGQAAGVCPRIEASLHEPAPSGYTLDVTGAYEFLTTRAAALLSSNHGAWRNVSCWSTAM